MSSTDTTDSSNKLPPKMMKVSDLPLYQPGESVSQFRFVEEPALPLQAHVSDVRKSLQTVYYGTNNGLDRVQKQVESEIDYVQSWREYLRKDTSDVVKGSLIVIGGVLGSMWGSRSGGRFRHILYTSVGLWGTAAFCYPHGAIYYTRAMYGQSRVALYTLKARAIPQLGQPSPAVKQDNSDMYTTRDEK